VAPVADDTTFYVDYGPVDGIVDETFTIDTLDTRRIFDQSGDNDNTGMHIWATNNFVPVWGIDPSSGASGEGYLDLGYTILPLYQGWLNPVLTLEKTSDKTTLPTEGGTATFTLQVNTYSLAPVTNINLADSLPTSWTYLPGTTLVTYPDGSTANPEPTQTGQDLSWNLSQTMASNQTLELQFQAQIQTGGSVGVTRADDFEGGQVYSGGTNNWAGPWAETDSGGGGATGGYVDISNAQPYEGNWHLRIRNDASIERSADLTDFANPVLRFKKRHAVDRNNENWYLEVYNGLSWTKVLTWSDGVEEGSYYQEEVDLSPYIATTTGIRFTTSGNLEDSDYLIVDDVEIYDVVVVNKNEAEVAGVYNGRSFNATDEATVYISALNLEKTVDKSTAQIGDTLLYTLAYENRGATTTNNAYIKDAIPLGTTFVSASNGGTYTGANNTVSWTLGDVAPSATDTVTFMVTVNKGMANGAIIENVGQIDSDQTELVDSNTVETTVLAPDLSLSKSGSTVAAPGDVVTYIINYANNGDASATGVVISDVIPASTTYVAGSLAINTGSGWVSLSDAVDADAGQYVASAVGVQPGTTPGTLAAGEAGQIRFQVTVDAGTPEGSTIGNVARISSDQMPTQNSNLLATDVSPLSISKASDRSVATAGQTTFFTITYGNDGGSTLTDVSLVDSIPANTELISGTVTGVGMDAIEFSTDNGATWGSSFTNPAAVTDIRWTRANLSAGQTGTVNFQVRLADPLPANSTIENTARITSTETAASGWLYSNEVSIGTIDLAISKVANAPFVRAGDSITYTITYGNNGSVAASAAVISDIIPANTSYVAGSISGTGADDSDPTHLVWNLGSVPANSGGYNASFVVKVSPGTTPGTPIYNTASLNNAYDSVDSNQVQVTVAQDGVTISPNRSDNSHDQGQQVCYGHTVGNTGSVNNTMELTPTHDTWTSATVSLYKDNDSDGHYDAGLDTLLTDTNGNTTIDTGELVPGQEIDILACFTIPTSGVDDGDTDLLVVEAATAEGATYSSQVTDTTDVRIENFLRIDTPPANTITNTTSISYSGVTNPNATVVITNTTTGMVYTVVADGFGNFATTIMLTPGSNTLTAQSVDLNGDTATDTRSVTQVPDPTMNDNFVTIIQPSTGTITSTATISVTGMTDPGSVLTVTVGSAGPYTTTADNSGAYGVTVILPDVGINTIVVTSTDLFGNEANATRDIRLTNDSTPNDNDLAIIFPPVGYVTDTVTIPVTGTTNADSVITATVGSNGPYTAIADSNGYYTVTVTLPDIGGNTIVLTSTDLYGNEATASRDVQIINTITLEFSKSAMDVDGPPLLISDTIRYTLQVTNTSAYTAFNVVVTDTLPVSITLVSTSTTQGSASGTDPIVWNVGNLSPNGGAATMVITVTLNPDTEDQSIINTGSVGGNNVSKNSDDVCPDGRAPNNGVCDSKPKDPSKSPGPGGIFLPIILKSS
jgi:uncharacterized repeat protein (TIGR01451 family)